jgi:hypothetical protein
MSGYEVVSRNVRYRCTLVADRHREGMVTTAFQRSSKEVHVVIDVEGVGPQDGFDIDVTPQCWGTESDGVPPDAHLRQSEKRGMCEARHLAR